MGGSGDTGKFFHHHLAFADYLQSATLLQLVASQCCRYFIVPSIATLFSIPSITCFTLDARRGLLIYLQAASPCPKTKIQICASRASTQQDSLVIKFSIRSTTPTTSQLYLRGKRFQLLTLK